MKATDESRKFERYLLPVVIQAPGISDLPLVPEDVSAGGFKVLVTKEPQLNELIECSIQISGEVYDDCEAMIAWVRDNEDETWYAGISVELLHGDRELFDKALIDANEGLK